MRFSINQNGLVLISDSNKATATGLEYPEETLLFPFDSDLVKTIIETGLASVPLEELVYAHLEERFSEEMQGVISAKERLYVKAATVFMKLQDDEDRPITETDTARMARELAESLGAEIKSVHP